VAFCLRGDEMSFKFIVLNAICDIAMVTCLLLLGVCLLSVVITTWGKEDHMWLAVLGLFNIINAAKVCFKD
jgi:hypothetical protein